jgi:hypothetical protein
VTAKGHGELQSDEDAVHFDCCGCEITNTFVKTQHGYILRNTAVIQVCRKPATQDEWNLMGDGATGGWERTGGNCLFKL